MVAECGASKKLLIVNPGAGSVSEQEVGQTPADYEAIPGGLIVIQ